jgi:hypothetical protein
MINRTPSDDEMAAKLVAKARELIESEARARRIAAAAQREMTVAQEGFNTLIQSAKLFGVDLLQELQRSMIAGSASLWDEPDSAAPKFIPLTLHVPTIREFALDAAKAAHPNPVRASTLRAMFKERYGKDVHEKSMGMTLYRIGQKTGAIRREGPADWFYVPEEERDVDEMLRLEFEGRAQ